MKLFNVVESEGYETFGLLKEDWDIISKYEGVETILEDWGERELRKDEESKKSDIAYFTDMPYSLLINEKAYKCLTGIIGTNEIELLPTKYKEQRYYLLHCIKAYDVKYEFKQDSNENYRMVFDRQDLIKKGLAEKGLFKIRYKGGAISDIFFTEQFIEIVNKFNLKGCEFRIAGELGD